MKFKNIDESINIEYFWEVIYNYVGYSSLSNEKKKNVDDIFKRIYNQISKESYSHDKSYIYNLNDIKIRDLKNNYGYWILDTELNILISNVYGCHQFLQPCFIALKLIKNKVNFTYEPSFFNEHNALSDIYIATRQGIYKSGANENIDIKYQPITCGEGFFMKNKKYSFLTQLFELDSIFYPYDDALKDLEKYVAKFQVND